jgi:polyhydroxybutyrate depolymerase
LSIKDYYRKKGGIMNRGAFLTTILVALLAARGFTQTTQTWSIKVNGNTRSCVVHVPSGIDKPALVYFVHGAFGSGAGFENDTKGDVTADREKFIAVYPSASSNGGSGTWADMYGTSDFPFYLKIRDTINARYHIDTNRVYMTGFSQGGMISFVAGCSFSNIFAAVAPVSGHSGTTCNLKRPVPVFMTFGTKDMGVVNGDVSSFLNDLKVWLKLDSCPSTPTITRPYPSSNPNSVVTRITYGPCAQGSYVVVDSIQGGGHGWPTDTRTSVNQADEVWAFFKQFTLNPVTGVNQKTVAAIREPVSASYSSGIVRLQGVSDKCIVKIINTKGITVSTESAVQHQFTFKNKPSGVYVVKVIDNNRPFSLRMIIP